jgi:hypothetical protein
MEMIIEEIEPVKKRNPIVYVFTKGVINVHHLILKKKQQLNTVLLINWKIWLM